jgi:hypothetical protein
MVAGGAAFLPLTSPCKVEGKQESRKVGKPTFVPLGTMWTGREWYYIYINIYIN